MSVLTSKLIVSLIDQVTAPLRGVNASIKNVQDQIRANNARMDEMRGRMVDAAGAALALGKALWSPSRAAIAFEAGLADIRKVSEFDDAGLIAYGKRLRELATGEIPMAVTELQELSAEAAASGVADADLFDFTRLAAKAGVAWDMSGGAAGEALAKIRTQLGMTNRETQLYADAINHVSDNTASKAPELLDFTKRVAAQGEFFGISKEATLAWGAAMVSTGAEAEVAATSFRNMGRALTVGFGATKRQRNAFRMIGVDPKQLAKDMQKDSGKAIMTVMQRISKLRPDMVNPVMRDIFGDEARALTPLLKRLDVLEKTLKLTADQTAYAGSVGREFEVRAATSEYQLQRLHNQVSDLGISIGNALLPAINDLTGVFSPLIKSLSELAERNPVVTRTIIGLTAAIIGFRVASTAAAWAGLFMRGSILQFGLAGLTATRGLAAVGRGVLAISFGPVIAGFRGLARSASLFSWVASGLGNGPAIAMLGRSLLGLLNPMQIVRSAFLALRVALISSGIGAVVVAVAAAGVWIYNNWSGLMSFFEGLGAGIKAGLAPVMPAVQPIVDGVSWLWDKLSGLTGEVNASNAEWHNWGETIGTVVGGAIAGVIEKFQALVGWIGKAWEGAKGIGSAVGSWFSGSGSAPAATPPALDGARASGGPVWGGGRFLVGEQGPELFSPSRSGFVLPAAATRALALASSLGAAVATPAHAINFDAYTLPEDVERAIMHTGEARHVGGTIHPARSSPTISQTNHIQITISGENGIDPEAIARELGRRVTERLEGGLFDIDTGA